MSAVQRRRGGEASAGVRLARPAVFALAAAAWACSPGGGPRPQLLVVVDTDLPTVSQAIGREELSADAAVDALRIDVYLPDGTPLDRLTVIAPAPEDWPISFGVPVVADSPRVLVQLRVFRSALAKSDPELTGSLTPEKSLSVDRIVALDFPSDGISVKRVTLHGDCLGVSPSFEAPPRTCVDAEHTTADAVEGVESGTVDDPVPTVVGTWSVATEVPCANPPVGSSVCIPGGFSLLGEQGLTGVADGFALVDDPAPLRPVQLSPFFLDREEYTVARLRDALMAEPTLLDSEEIRTYDPADTLKDACTFLGPGNGANDALPVNCVTYSAARKLCEAAGGELPSEAQWEHAARGRGQHRPYAWGFTVPDCCHGTYSGCVSTLQAPGTGKCGEDGDVTRDGVLDMTGNAEEMTLDKYVAYDAPCWAGPGVLVDPVCDDASVTAVTWRGGDFLTGAQFAHLALRRQGLPKAPVENIGFRCAYLDSP